MAGSKSSATVDIYATLKKVKLLGEKYKGKRFTQLTPSQRGYVTRLSRELKSVIQSPANFVIRKVKSTDTVKSLKAQGFKVVNGHAVIRVDFDGAVKIESRKNKSGTRTTHVKITNKFEEKTSYSLRMQDLIASGEIPLWIKSMQANFGPRDSWAIGIAGKPIGDFFQDIESLMEYFESYLEGQLDGVDAAKCVLMHVHASTPTTNAQRTPRKKEIKDANERFKADKKFRH